MEARINLYGNAFASKFAKALRLTPQGFSAAS